MVSISPDKLASPHLPTAPFSGLSQVGGPRVSGIDTKQRCRWCCFQHTVFGCVQFPDTTAVWAIWVCPTKDESSQDPQDEFRPRNPRDQSRSVQRIRDQRQRPPEKASWSRKEISKRRWRRPVRESLQQKDMRHERSVIFFWEW